MPWESQVQPSLCLLRATNTPAGSSGAAVGILCHVVSTIEEWEAGL